LAVGRADCKFQITLMVIGGLTRITPLYHHHNQRRTSGQRGMAHIEMLVKAKTVQSVAGAARLSSARCISDTGARDFCLLRPLLTELH
jgi:hypothetical protein